MYQNFGRNEHICATSHLTGSYFTKTTTIIPKPLNLHDIKELLSKLV